VLGDRRVRAAYVRAGVRSDALVVQDDLDRRRGQPCLDVRVQVRVRDGVEVMVDLDVIVDVDLRGLPLCVAEGLGR
jgi:hypothetical protein